MAKLGFTFYPKDWWTSDTFYELDPIERYLYLEIMFFMYQNDGYFTLTKIQLERRLLTQIKPSEWEKITQLLTHTELGYTHSSVKKRRSKADVSRENGAKGGRPKKPNNPEINPPLEYKEKEKRKEYKENEENVLEFLKSHSTKWETFVMQNKSRFKDWDKMIELYSYKVDEENIEYTYKKLIARLSRWMSSWETNCKKKQKRNNNIAF